MENVSLVCRPRMTKIYYGNTVIEVLAVSSITAIWQHFCHYYNFKIIVYYSILALRIILGYSAEVMEAGMGGLCEEGARVDDFKAPFVFNVLWRDIRGYRIEKRHKDINIQKWDKKTTTHPQRLCKNQKYSNMYQIYHILIPKLPVLNWQWNKLIRYSTKTRYNLLNQIVRFPSPPIKSKSLTHSLTILKDLGLKVKRSFQAHIGVGNLTHQEILACCNFEKCSVSCLTPTTNNLSLDRAI